MMVSTKGKKSLLKLIAILALTSSVLSGKTKLFSKLKGNSKTDSSPRDYQRIEIPIQTQVGDNSSEHYYRYTPEIYNKLARDLHDKEFDLEGRSAVSKFAINLVKELKEELKSKKKRFTIPNAINFPIFAEMMGTEWLEIPQDIKSCYRPFDAVLITLKGILDKLNKKEADIVEVKGVDIVVLQGALKQFV